MFMPMYLRVANVDFTFATMRYYHLYILSAEVGNSAALKVRKCLMATQEQKEKMRADPKRWKAFCAQRKVQKKRRHIKMMSTPEGFLICEI